MDGKLSFEIVDEEWAASLQQGLEDYMMMLHEALIMDDAERYDDPEEQEFDPLLETESGIVFCGCNVCEYREILAYTTPRIIDGYLTRRVNLVKE